ncbi:MAG: extracellular solute-binding protein [Gammaproteobacteria bacterium]|nr:extracellular solute-binding protein [Gammaproteobacteria bacterium]
MAISMRFFSLVALLLWAFPLAHAQNVVKSWSMAEFGTPLYKRDIAHWPYANPAAPKGGEIVLGAFGSFDSLNTYILKGEWPRSIGLTGDSLMSGSGDELASAYGVIAESVEYPQDKSWIIFNLRPDAHYEDGVQITAGDFAFGFETIRKHGRPFLRSFYADVEGVEALDDRRLKFTMKTRNNMKPLMNVAGLSPLPRHHWETRDITKTTLEPEPSSGAYRITSVDAGRSITYELVDNYWGKDLAINRGLNNIQRIRFEYYRDDGVMFEAFKSGAIDFRQENSSKRWATGYENSPAVKKQQIVRRRVPNETPQGIQAFFFNLRRAPFDDKRVREAIALLFDFEAVQRTVLYGEYQRTASYFPNSDFGASGTPAGAELQLLEPFREQLPAALFAETFTPPKTDGSGRIRRQLRKALELFKAAGWSSQGGKLTKGGKQMAFEFLLVSPTMERLVAPFVQNLKRTGIAATIRIVDSSQYEVRVDDFDFDVISVRLNFFPPPGPELRSYYGSAAAEVRGSANMAGIKNPVIDALIEKIINAEDLESLKHASRALDRVLLWNHYVIPQFFIDNDRIVHWDKFGYPDRKPRYSVGFPSTWWIDEERAAKLTLQRK